MKVFRCISLLRLNLKYITANIGELIKMQKGTAHLGVLIVLKALQSLHVWHNSTSLEHLQIIQKKNKHKNL